MRRDSLRARGLAAALSSRVPAVTTRRIEGWSGDGLGPLDGAEFDSEVEHFAVLSTLAGSGRSADTTAVLMAARGFVCRRLHAAMCRQAGVVHSGTPTPAIDLSPGPAGDDGFAELERLARNLAATTKELPQPIRAIAEAMRRNASRTAASLGEPGEELFHSFLVNTLSLLVNDEFYDATGLAAVLGVGSATGFADAITVLNTQLRLTISDADQAYRDACPQDVATVAPLVRDVLCAALSWLGAGDLPDGDIDQLAVMMAPLLLAVLGRIAGTTQDAVTMLGAWATEDATGCEAPDESVALPSNVAASG